MILSKCIILNRYETYTCIGVRVDDRGRGQYGFVLVTDAGYGRVIVYAILKLR